MSTGIQTGCDKKPHDLISERKDGEICQTTCLSFGHRVWHGFALANSQDNNWGVYDEFPPGGYMDDLWCYTKILDLKSVPGQNYRSNDGMWKLWPPAVELVDAPGAAWEEQLNVETRVVKPEGRAGHGSAYDSGRNRYWIWGGYHSYYPYLKTDKSGSGPGTQAVGTNGFIPYPGFDYWLNDMWYYDFNLETWVEVKFPPGSKVPDPRQDFVFMLIGETNETNGTIFFMHGGYADNFLYDDTWYYNISAGQWIEKEDFVIPQYVEECIDDMDYIKENNCEPLDWPDELERNHLPPFEILNMTEQPWYVNNTGGSIEYFGLFPKDFPEQWAEMSALEKDNIFEGGAADIGRWSDTRAVQGDPIAPRAASGLRQYARKHTEEYVDSENNTVTLHMYILCTSVFGEPTRGMVDREGNPLEKVLIPTPRRARPGWDGCRARRDGRSKVNANGKIIIQYEMRIGRMSHAAAYWQKQDEIFLYGGTAYDQFYDKSLAVSHPLSVVSDMWYYNFNHCVNNCSDHGNCYFGFCLCYTGFYGPDCSNTSCPGTYCYVDGISHEQFCTHACQSGFDHLTRSDKYVQDITKIPCSYNNPGYSNGICDGYGTVMCAPPFIGSDCSIRDCKDQCNFNGWCSVEYPISRCNCHPGYYGETCEKQICLNNCSYPNGICDPDTGDCECHYIRDPFVNTRDFKKWGGLDCSYIFPYSSAPPSFQKSITFSVVIAILSYIFIFD